MKGWGNRQWWGVRTKDMLLGTAWDKRSRLVPATEPTRPLLFTTRACAREWCRTENHRYGSFPEGHVCREWKFTPVRVTEGISV